MQYTVFETENCRLCIYEYRWVIHTTVTHFSPLVLFLTVQKSCFLGIYCNYLKKTISQFWLVCTIVEGSAWIIMTNVMLYMQFDSVRPLWLGACSALTLLVLFLFWYFCLLSKLLLCIIGQFIWPDLGIAASDWTIFVQGNYISSIDWSSYNADQISISTSNIYSHDTWDIQ